MDIRIWKLRERLDMQLCELQLCRTYDQQADYQSKQLPLRMHRYFRDNVGGYALVMLQNPDRKMPPNCIKYEELISILNDFSDKDCVSKNRAVATKAKLKEDKKASRRRKFASKPPEIVRDAKGVPVHKHQAPSQQRSTQKPKRRR